MTRISELEHIDKTWKIHRVTSEYAINILQQLCDSGYDIYKVHNSFWKLYQDDCMVQMSSQFPAEDEKQRYVAEQVYGAFVAGFEAKTNAIEKDYIEADLKSISSFGPAWDNCYASFFVKLNYFRKTKPFNPVRTKFVFGITSEGGNCYEIILSTNEMVTVTPPKTLKSQYLAITGIELVPSTIYNVPKMNEKIWWQDLKCNLLDNLVEKQEEIPKKYNVLTLLESAEDALKDDISIERKEEVLQQLRKTRKEEIEAMRDR